MRHRTDLVISPVISWGLSLLWSLPAGAQTPSSSGTGSVVASVDRSREAQLEDEVQQLKTMVRDLSTRLDQISNQLPRPATERSGTAADGVPRGGADTAGSPRWRTGGHAGHLRIDGRIGRASGASRTASHLAI